MSNNNKLIQKVFKNFMRDALIEAHKAKHINEIPIGAVITNRNKIIASAHNIIQKYNDPTAHAELLVIQKSCKILSKKYLIGCKLYVTIEPCLMCAQAIAFSKIQSIYFSIYNKKIGAICSNTKIFSKIKNSWKTNIHHGILEKKCFKLIKTFFSNRI